MKFYCWWHVDAWNGLEMQREFVCYLARVDGVIWKLVGNWSTCYRVCIITVQWNLGSKLLFITCQCRKVHGPWTYNHCSQHGVAGHSWHKFFIICTNTAPQLGVFDVGRSEPGSSSNRSSAGKFSIESPPPCWHVGWNRFSRICAAVDSCVVIADRVFRIHVGERTRSCMWHLLKE